MSGIEGMPDAKRCTIHAVIPYEKKSCAGSCTAQRRSAKARSWPP